MWLKKSFRLEMHIASWTSIEIDRYQDLVQNWLEKVIRGVRRYAEEQFRIIRLEKERRDRKLRMDNAELKTDNAELRARVAELEAERKAATMH